MRQRPAPPSGDEGFGLVESLVAVFVFGVVAVVTAGLLTSMLSATGSSTRRTVAANLAATEIDRYRVMRALDIPDSAEVRTVRLPDPVKGISYQVTRTSTYVTSGSSTTVCGGAGSNIIYKLITVTVSWPGMGSTRPVRSDTLKSLGLGTDALATNRGVAVVQLADHSGTPTAGVVVALSPGGTTRQTGVDGCAVFTDLIPGTTYTAAVDQAGHTDPRMQQSASRSPITVAAGEVTRASLSYSAAGALQLPLQHLATHPAPAQLGLSLGTTVWPESSLPFTPCVAPAVAQCFTGSPRQVSRLYPASYSGWAGTCTARPASSGVVAVRAAQVSTLTVPLAALSVELRGLGGEVLANRTLHMSAVTGGSCTERYAAVSDAAGVVRVSLPGGRWSLSTTADGSGGPWPTVELDVTSTAVVQQTVTSP